MYPIDLKFRPLDPAEPGFFPLLVSCNFLKVEVGMKTQILVHPDRGG